MQVFSDLIALARDIQFVFQSPWIPASRAELCETLVQNCLYSVIRSRKTTASPYKGEATFVRPTTADPGSFITRNGVPDGVDSVTVPTVRLSTAVNRLGSVDLLKLDIEGSEYEVLGELEQTRAIDKIKACVIEYHAHKCPNPIEDVVSLLSRNHFPYRLRADWKPWFELDDPHIVMIYAKKTF